MTTLRQRIYEDNKSDPRSLLTVVRCVGLIVPDDHALAVDVGKCLDSMAFASPETHILHFRKLVEAWRFHFSGGDVETTLSWSTVVYLLFCGGSPRSDDVFQYLISESTKTTATVDN